MSTVSSNRLVCKADDQTGLPSRIANGGRMSLAGWKQYRATCLSPPFMLRTCMTGCGQCTKLSGNQTSTERATVSLSTVKQAD